MRRFYSMWGYEISERVAEFKGRAADEEQVLHRATERDAVAVCDEAPVVPQETE